MPKYPEWENIRLLMLPQLPPIPLLANPICVLVTPEYRGQVAEVEVGREEYLSRTSAINCVNIFTKERRKAPSFRTGMDRR